MVRNIYRSLINTGRTYAAFDKNSVLPIIKEIQRKKNILDPMAGYGSLMLFCSEIGISTYNIEYNPPSFLWMVLINPNNAKEISRIIDTIIHKKEGLPKFKTPVVVSSGWFPDQSYEIIEEIYCFIYNITEQFFQSDEIEKISLAILIPFIGRFSSCVPGNSVSHVKAGGICIYINWLEDFLEYLYILKQKIINIDKSAIAANHTTVFGDVRTLSINKKFSAMITSPPYPNSRDYYKMFLPENEILKYLKSNNIINNYIIEEPLISNISVSALNKKGIDNSKNLISKSAITFLEKLSNYDGVKRAKYDNKIYYVPYFSNYFYNIEKAINNISKMISDDFEGYVIVVNNTARNLIIPVAESIIEVFSELGFKAMIAEPYTRELFHFGAINPVVKGFKAKHMEYTIKIWRS
jgi:hypothetical protein